MSEVQKESIQETTQVFQPVCAEISKALKTNSNISKKKGEEEGHKFKSKVSHSHEEIARLMYTDYIRVMKKMAEYMGEEKLLEMLAKANDETIPVCVSADPNFNFTEWNKENDEMFKNVATWEVVESNEKIHRLKVSECLFANIFREYDAAELGFVTHCRMAEVYGKNAHPSITAPKTKTLMRGDEYCDSVWLFND